jgi:hypothetical protein
VSNNHEVCLSEGLVVVAHALGFRRTGASVVSLKISFVADMKREFRAIRDGFTNHPSFSLFTKIIRSLDHHIRTVCYCNFFCNRL